MKAIRHITLGLATGLLALSIASSAYANNGNRHQKAFPKASMMQPSFAPQMDQRLPQWAQVRVSAAQAKSIAQQRVPGAQVVDVALNGNTYRVRLIHPDGRVVDVYVDATTGRAR